jgi:hypothetical protein
MTDMPKDALEYSITVQMYERQATSWLERYQDLDEKLRVEEKIGKAAKQYMSYLAEFYVSCAVGEPTPTDANGLTIRIYCRLESSDIIFRLPARP